MNTNQDNQQQDQNRAPLVQVRQYRPRLAFYHANDKGTGCAMTLELHPAHDSTEGCIMATMANQKTVGNKRSPNPTYSTFNWDESICVKLDFSDLSQMLQVFRGENESLGSGGKGLFHMAARHSTSIRLRHTVTPYSGYSLEMYRTKKDGASASAHILLTASEAYGLAAAIEGSLGVICFGMPMVIPHDTSAYRREAREARNASAA